MKGEVGSEKRDAASSKRRERERGRRWTSKKPTDAAVAFSALQQRAVLLHEPANLALVGRQQPARQKTPGPRTQRQSSLGLLHTPNPAPRVVLSR